MFIKILTKTYKGEKRYYASNLPKDQKTSSPLTVLGNCITRDIEQEQAEHLKNDYKHRMSVNRTLCVCLKAICSTYFWRKILKAE